MPTLRRHDDRQVSDEMGVAGMREGGEEPAPEEEVPRIFVEIPRCTAQIGTDLHFVKLPNFLSVETRSACVKCELNLSQIEGRALLR